MSSEGSLPCIMASAVDETEEYSQVYSTSRAWQQAAAGLAGFYSIATPTL